MTLLMWIVVAGGAIVAVTVVLAPQLPDGTEGHRRNLAGLLTVLVPFALPVYGLIAYLVPGANEVCPYDATCSMPYAPLALLGGPVLAVGAVGAAWTGVRRSWTLRFLVPLLIALLVTLAVVLLAGLSYRIVVPRP